MSDKYIAKKYVAVANLTDKIVKCPNCHQPMALAGRILYCLNNPTVSSMSALIKYRTHGPQDEFIYDETDNT
jgi:hypothetical protein